MAMTTFVANFGVRSIDDSTKNETIIVRILRLWAQTNKFGKVGLEMILMDEWGDKIQASVTPTLKKNFEKKLIEGEITSLRNFKVLENIATLQRAKINHAWKIGFSLDILGIVNTTTITLVDITMMNGTISKMCDIELLDSDGKSIICALWDSYATKLKSFMDAKSSEDKEPVIVALQFAMITSFKGGKKVTTMKNATNFFIQPDIQEVKDFIRRRGVSGTSSIQSISTAISSVRELKSEEWLNVAYMRSIEAMKNSNEVGTYTCKGKIVDLHDKDSWYYDSCGNKDGSKDCFKRVPHGSKVGDNCEKCKAPIGSITTRYYTKILVEDVEDKNVQEYFTLFEECAFYFLKKSAHQVMQEHEETTGDRSGTPEILSNLLERICLFRVDYATRFSDHRVYTIKNVTEDKSLIEQFSSMEVNSKSKEIVVSVEKSLHEEENSVQANEEICSNSEGTNIITPKKRRCNSKDDDVEDDDGDVGDANNVQISSTKASKK